MGNTEQAGEERKVEGDNGINTRTETRDFKEILDHNSAKLKQPHLLIGSQAIIKAYLLLCLTYELITITN